MTEEMANFRLAIRTEGNMVNCYLAKEDSMDGATLLASCNRMFFDDDLELWERWKKLMADGLEAGIKAVGGKVTRFEERPTEK